MELIEIICQLCEWCFDFVKWFWYWKIFGWGWMCWIMGEWFGIQSDDIGVIDWVILMVWNVVVGVQQILVLLFKVVVLGKVLEDDVKIMVVFKEVVWDLKWFGILGVFGFMIVIVVISFGFVVWVVVVVLVGGGIYLIYCFEWDWVIV